MPRFGPRPGTAVHLGSLALVFVAAACSSPSHTTDTGPTAIAIGSGNQQIAKYGTAVPAAPTVVVTNATGVMPDVIVTFTPSTGGAVGAATATTNAQGVASVSSWTLAPTPGSQTLRASVGSLSVTLTATAVTGPASAASIEAGNGQTWVTGSRVPVQPSILVTDGTFPVPGAHVSFSVTGGAGSLDIPIQTTDANGVATVGGWTLGTVGANSVSATVTGTSIPAVQFNATAQALVITSFTKDAGDNQTGFAGNFAVIQPTVLVLNQFNQPTQGVPVTFAVTGGGGTLSYAVDTTGNDGRAALGAWRYGTTGIQAVSATTASVAPVSFTATATTPPATSAFDIQLVYMGTPPSADVQAAFTAAVARWRQIIVGALPPVVLSGTDVIGPYTINTGISGLPPILCIPQTSNTTINGIRIFVGVQAIDGDQGSNILGLSTPVYVRTASSLPYAACMIFDSANLQDLVTTGQLSTVILHEMAHSFGFGTIWTDLALLGGACPTSDLPYFKGPSSKQAFNGALPLAAVFTEPEVPVEGQGSCNDGTRDGHWSEEVFDNELMTGFINQGSNPLSAVTSASMRDLGYQVNDAVSDPYTVPFQVPALRTTAARGMKIHELNVRTPIIATDLTGHTNRIIDR